MATSQYNLPSWIDKLSIEDAVKLILLGFFGTTPPSGGGSGTGGVIPASWVRHSVLLNDSAQAIPAGAFYQYSVLTGTAGDGTMTGLPAGYSDSSPVPITTGFTITAAAASTAAVVWWTQS